MNFEAIELYIDALGEDRHPSVVYDASCGNESLLGRDYSIIEFVKSDGKNGLFDEKLN